MRRKHGFTISEMLVVMSIITVIIGAAVVLARSTGHGLYTGQVEMSNRTKLEDNIYYLAKDIESAKEIGISDDYKTLKIRQEIDAVNDTDDNYPSVYTMENDAFNYNDSKMFDLNVDADTSTFELDVTAWQPVIRLKLYLKNNDIDTDQSSKLIEYEFMTKNENVIINGKTYTRETPEKYFNWDGTAINGFSDECPDGAKIDVVIPKKCTEIKNSAFMYCDTIKTVIIPDSTTSIGESAFDSCESLTSVDIPNSVINIGRYAFWGTALTSIYIPDSVTHIEPFIFEECTKLKTISAPTGLTSYEAELTFGNTAVISWR